MTRDIDATSKAAAGSEVARVIALVLLDFASSAVRATSAPFDIAWGGDTYLGVGNFGKIAPVEEKAEQQAYSLQFQLSGIPTSLVSTALQEYYQGRDAKLWIGFLDADHNVIGTPVLVFWGLMDTMDLTFGKSAEIVVTAHSRLVRWEDAPNKRYNNATQQARYPGDKGLEFMEQMTEKELKWPK